MFIKRCNTRITQVVSKPDLNSVEDFKRRIGSRFELDLDKNIYIRNESVHAEETHGANDNGDAFPSDELRNRYSSFIGSRVTFDHNEKFETGSVIDSVYIQPVIAGKVVTSGDYVENFLKVDKERAEALRPGSVARIIAGDFTDTSMGAIVAFTECSVCTHRAYTEDEYCEHITAGKNRMVTAADGSEKKVYERCFGVTFFEDSIIIPAQYGGIAGGRGADKDAKMLDIIVASKRDNMLANLIKWSTTLTPDQQHGLEKIIDELVRG